MAWFMDQRNVRSMHDAITPATKKKEEKNQRKGLQYLLVKQNR